MSKEREHLIKMQCTVCKQLNYQTSKKPQLKDRLELKKFCSTCKKEGTGKKGVHTLHKETK